MSQHVVTCRYSTLKSLVRFSVHRRSMVGTEDAIETTIVVMFNHFGHWRWPVVDKCFMETIHISRNVAQVDEKDFSLIDPLFRNGF